MAYQFHPVVLFFLLIFKLLCSSRIQQVSAKLLLEEGYTVTTLLDGNKLSNRINPSSVLPRFGKTHELVILDTPTSAFYTIRFPISQDSEITRLSGNGTAGFSDGDLVSAMFDRPRSFAVDLKGNVYVADKNNHAIRKISKEGVATTIAGGYTGKPGKADGPAQNASFSEDFELVFVPELCALVISDRGNRLVRQMSLKPSDCATGSQLGLGLTWVSLLFGVFGLILGLIIGFAATYFLVSREISGDNHLNMTWKHYLINLGRQLQIVCSGIKRGIVSSRPYPLMVRPVRMIISHLSLMFRIPIVEKQNFRNPVSLLDSNGVGNHEVPKEELFVE